MPRVTFEALPATARLWIFAAERCLTADEEARLLGATDTFLDQWAAHGMPLTAARDWRHGRFLMIGVDEAAAGASGCSIDALVGQLRSLEGELGAAILDHGPVVFRDAGEIRRVSRAEFAALAESGSVDPETTVFNNTLTSVGQVRDGLWEGPASRSWHAHAFFPDGAGA